jgi:hypothetical protein
MEALNSIPAWLIPVPFIVLLWLRVAELKADQYRINRKLELLLNHLNVDIPLAAQVGYVPPELLPQVRGLIEERKKIDAIKLLKERTGLSLLDAKNTIDALERTL